jgi:hypothetical protein
MAIVASKNINIFQVDISCMNFESSEISKLIVGIKQACPPQQFIVVNKY